MKRARRILNPIFNEGNQARTTTRINATGSAPWKFRYYGIQTSRMVKVSGCAHLPVIFYPGMHRALFRIKKACALANAEIGALKPEISRAVVEACDRALACEFDKEFPLDMWQGGGYTCINMNVNEVIGNAANEILTGRKVRTPCTRTPM